MDLMNVMRQIGSGFGSTLIIFFFTLLFSMPLGVLVAKVVVSSPLPNAFTD